ncbi:sigma-54 dependent transcriptional regulator [Uliginosibacterium sp. H3]|uniref:Sigma-54 dependent transcriptional regulator n=1 Tax=Uliginosibacterium silvisoli TaxID=3114758 RepID=A0ABU6K7P0_9RHOO|nr:sigma-54 dependent transcriptional regulator [Uliginosibacterium sp. H3]
MSDASVSAEKVSAATPDRFGVLLGGSPAMQELYRQIERVASTNASVLIIGESGTGKELLAKTVHDRSARSNNPFIPVNCGAIPAKLVEAELFGHEKGSFTGATHQHIGYFEHATKGTVFLDEVTEMASDMQIKLLRVLETESFHRVGGTDLIRVDMRVVAATNRDPFVAVSDGIFREDLLYRLAVVPIRVPPLRERGDDVELLAQHFLNDLNKGSKTEKVFSRRALDVVRGYAWPGNVRELRNTIHRAFILADKNVDIADPYAASSGEKTSISNGMLSLPIGTPLAEAQREIILATLKHFDGDKRQVALALGISLKTLYNRLEIYQAGGV